MKLMIALATASMIVTSAFMQPAVAQRRTGNGYSGTGEDETFVGVQFNLVDKDRDGKIINESGTETDDFVGFFPGAIENYKQGNLARACLSFDVEPICTSGSVNGRYVLDDSGFLILLEEFDTSSIIPVDGDLKAELIINDPLFPGTPNTIAYSIFRLGETEPIQRYRLDFSAFDFNQDQAINDLSYILEQNLFSKVRVFSNFDENVLGISDVLLQNTFEEDIRNVPESQATNGVMILGFLGAVSLLKRQIRRYTD
ncbi:hypothetical protein A4S05_10325 [Nostoc sp. KVJ20]|uniref:hypothetical protein n=1 Tax=Nostoc sp. KVJ20 TaxID=457944 RepID=UPI00083D4CE2|nr:hypothetical protein [Nostoc sp. KVJ20]ODG98163.1 hypothetical protein A4S05_10325 [Nostoc sp. KVJ20]